MSRKSINPKSLFDSTSNSFSQVTIGEGTRIVTISGQVALDTDMQIIGDDLASQTMKAIENVEQAILGVGGSLDDILSLRIYVVQSAMSDDGVQEALKSFFPDSPPTLTWIGISSLARPEFLVEVEAMAVLS